MRSIKLNQALACATAALPLLSFAQADTDAVSIAVASLRSQKAQCENVKEAPARARCMEGVATLALRLLESSPKQRAAAAPAADDSWSPLVTQGMAYLTRSFKDPSGVKYRNLVLSGGQSNPMALCGEVNGRNSYGAYVGFRRFFVLLPQLSAEIEERGSDLVSRVWGDFCETRKRADVDFSQAGEISVRRAPDSGASAATAGGSGTLPSGCPAAAPGCSWARPVPAPEPAAPAAPAEGTSADGCPAAAPGCSWGKR